MSRLLAGMGLAALIVGAAAAVDQGQAPVQIQNGRIEARSGTSIAAEIASAGASADPVWVGWRVPAVDGDRDRCMRSSWTTSNETTYFVRAGVLESTSAPVAQPAAPRPIPLEGGTNLVVLVRVVDKRIERLRSFGDDCPLDAGGRTVYWLGGVTPAESIKYLDSLVHGDGLSVPSQRSLTSEAISAIALHRDTSADAVLDRLTADREADVRRQAGQLLGTYRGAHGFDMLRQLVANERSMDSRQTLVSAIAQTRQPQTAEVLLALAQKDADKSVRAEAAYWYPQRAGLAGVDATLAIIRTDADENVKTRAVSGLSRLPADQIVPRLIELARSNTNLAVRKRAVTALGDSKDPRALAYLAEVISK